MKQNNLCYRFFICMMMVLTICHPSLQLTAASFSSSSNVTNDHLSSSVIGSLENGINYSFIPSNLKEGTWIKLSCAISTEKEKAFVSLLTQHALFYGTKQYDRQFIANQLDRLGLDVEADSYVQSNESEKSLQLCLPGSQPEMIRDVLSLLNQMVFSPTLTHEQVELARNHLLSTLELTEEESLAVKSVTAVEIQQFHAQWYFPKNIHLTFIGFNNPQEISSILAETFESPLQFNQELPIPSLPPVSLETGEENVISCFAEQVEWTEDHQSLVVDGKIWMKEPNWINTSSKGKSLGALLTVLGIGGMILAFPIAAPIALIAGGLTTATGVYFLATPYLKDPHYIESARQTDLKKGCAHAYKNSRAGLTLTPYERRAIFLQEMVDHPQTLSKLPILLLADLYQLNDPIIAEIFTVDEFNVLTRLKRDFVQQRNQYKLLKETLEKELAALTAPHRLARDAALLHAQDVYNQNYYVVLKYNLKIDRDQRIEDAEYAFEKGKISLKEKEEIIKEAQDDYEAYLDSPEIKTGLNLAEIHLTQMELDINTTYNYHVEICKQSIQYNQRMSYYQQGEQSLIHFFNQELYGLLATFPVYLSVLSDYLDLRNL